MWGIFDLIAFKVILGSLGTFVSKKMAPNSEKVDCKAKRDSGTPVEQNYVDIFHRVVFHVIFEHSVHLSQIKPTTRK